MKKGIVFFILLISFSSQAGEVIDLGKFEVKGKVRGPEIQLIDPNQMSKDSAGSIVAWQLKKLEEKALVPSFAEEK